MKRQGFIRFGELTVPRDVAPLLKKLSDLVLKAGYGLQFSKPTKQKEDKFSLVPAGREVWIRLDSKKETLTQQHRLALLWSFAIPLKITPWLRYPIPDESDHVFHLLGPWQVIYDRLLSEGRGDLAWPSVCIAAQCDVGTWKGDKVVERSVQAHLHRVGTNPGALDGIIGPKTLSAIKAASLDGMPLEKVLAALLQRETVGIPTTKRRTTGHVVLPGCDFVVQSFGKVNHNPTVNGTSLIVRGPGRVVIDIAGGTDA